MSSMEYCDCQCWKLFSVKNDLSFRGGINTYLTPHTISEFAIDVHVGVGLQLVGVKAFVLVVAFALVVAFMLLVARMLI